MARIFFHKHVLERFVGELAWSKFRSPPASGKVIFDKFTATYRQGTPRDCMTTKPQVRRMRCAFITGFYGCFATRKTFPSPDVAENSFVQPPAVSQ